MKLTPHFNSGSPRRSAVRATRNPHTAPTRPDGATLSPALLLCGETRPARSPVQPAGRPVMLEGGGRG